MRFTEPIPYPKIGYISEFKTPDIFLGNEINYQLKYDGSNIAVFVDNVDVTLQSRSGIDAHINFYNTFYKCANCGDLMLMCRSSESAGYPIVAFIELMTVGKSPTRVQTHEVNSFVCFDILDISTGLFLSPQSMEYLCRQFGVPTSAVVWKAAPASLHDISVNTGVALSYAEELGYEGVVAKCVIDEKVIMFKDKTDILREKLRTAKEPKEPRDTERLPDLDDRDVNGAISKVYDEIGAESMRSPKIAMPLVAAQIVAEAKKHGRSPPRDMFGCYRKWLGGL